MKPEDKRRVQPSGGGGGGGEGHVCHACGWTYANPHPSAKQRRSHRKHCGKSAAAAAAATEGGGGAADGRRVSDEELSDEDRRKRDGVDAAEEGSTDENGGGEKGVDRTGSDGEMSFGGLDKDIGDLEKDGNVGDNNVDNILELCALLNGDPNIQCSEIQLTTREHLAGHAVLNNSRTGGTEITTLDDGYIEETELLDKQGPQHVTVNANVIESAENTDNNNSVHIPTASVLSGDSTNMSSYIYSGVENADKYVEISVPMNHSNGIGTVRKDFPTEIDANMNGLDLSTSYDEQTQAEMAHNESLCGSSLEINACEHVDASASESEGNNSNDLSIESNTPSEDNSQVVGSLQNKIFPIESDGNFDSVGAKARDELENHLEGEVPEMISSVLSLGNSDEITGEDPLNGEVDEINSLHDKSFDASSIDYSTIWCIKNKPSPTVTEVDTESAPTLAISEGPNGLGSLALDYNQVNSRSMVGESSGFQETASDNEFLDSLEHEIELLFEETEINQIHEGVSGSNAVVSDVDCDAHSAVSHFSEAFITDDERPDLFQEENGLNLHVDGDNNALEVADSHPESSSKYLEISRQELEYLSDSPPGQLNYQKVLEETNAEAGARDESNNLSLLKECCNEGESEIGHRENVSGHEFSLGSEHKDGLAETMVDNHNDHSSLFWEISGIKEVLNGKTTSDDTESTTNKSVTKHESDGNGIFEVISSGDCHQNLLEDHLHVESEEEPDFEIVTKNLLFGSKSDVFEEKQGLNPDGDVPEIEHKTNELPILHTQTPVRKSADATKVLSFSDTAINDWLRKNRSRSRDFIVTSPPPPAHADFVRPRMGREIHVEKRAQQEIQARKDEEVAANVVRWNSQKDYVPLRALLADANFGSNQEPAKADNITMPTTTAYAKSRSRKDEARLPRPASSRSSADRKEWSSPARLPKGMDDKRRAKGKLGWMPFMCCPSTN